MIDCFQSFACGIGEIREGARDPPEENDAFFVGDGGNCFDHSLGRLLAQQLDERRTRLGLAEAPEGTSDGTAHIGIKVFHKFDKDGNHRRRSADASASAGANARIRMPQEIKHDVGRQIGTQVHGSRNCRDETGTLNDTRDDNPDDRSARRGAANYGKRFQRCALLRNGAIGAKADKPPAKTFKRWNRCSKPAPSGFGRQLGCVGDPCVRYCFDQRGIVKASWHQGLLSDHGAGRAVLGRCSAFGEQVELLGGHALSL
jgi:hypothetical protein